MMVPWIRRLLTSALALAVVPIVATPVGAQEPEPTPDVLAYLVPTSDEPDGSDGWSLEELLGAPIDLHPRVQSSALFQRGGVAALGELETAFDTRVNAETRLRELEVELVIARARIEGTAARAAALQDELSVLAAERILVEERLGDFVVSAFLGGELDGLDRRPDGSPDARPVVARDAAVALRRAVSDARDAEDRARERLATSRRQLEVREQDAIAVAAEDERVRAELADVEGRIEELRSSIGDDLFGLELDGGGLTPRAISAYLFAAELAPSVAPGCTPTWWQLAGIGRVESRHGTFGGATLGIDGVPDIPIIGPQLNGEVFASIGDTDGGELDGDTEWDRAVGPMQFIPQSWARFRADGDGDGDFNPQDLDDAALAAARHLCGSVPGMSTPEQYATALFGYNRSQVYVAEVQHQAALIEGFDELLG